MKILFGAGTGTIKYLSSEVSKKMDFSFIVDNDPKLYGTKLFNIPVKSPEVLKNYLENNVEIFITALDEKSIQKQLMHLGFKSTQFHVVYKNLAAIERNCELNFNVTLAEKVLVIISRVLQTREVPHMFAYGTLLGLVRDRCVICHDYDIDLWIQGEYLSESTLIEILDEILKLQSDIIHVRIKETLLPENKHIDYRGTAKKALNIYFSSAWLRIDFNFLCKGKTHYFMTHNGKDLYALPKHLFRQTKLVCVFDELFSVLSDPERVLEAIYGDWRIPTKPDSSGGYFGHLHKVNDI